MRKWITHIRYSYSPAKFNGSSCATSRLKHLSRPDFLIIGAPKCGTSWLQRALDQHPGICLVPDEIEYFSMHLNYPLDWYLSHFSRLKARNVNPKAPSLLGEKSARYCSLEPARIRLIHDLLPDAKIILMTRDPVARQWAQAKQYFSKRRFNKLEGGVLAIPREELFAFFERMRPLSEFSSIIRNWSAIYPARQFLVLSQERTLDYPRATFDAVLGHIGASRDYDSADIALLTRRKNVGPKIEMPDDVKVFLESEFAAERQYLRDFFCGAPSSSPLPD